MMTHVALCGLTSERRCQALLSMSVAAAEAPSVVCVYSAGGFFLSASSIKNNR